MAFRVQHTGVDNFLFLCFRDQYFCYREYSIIEIRNKKLRICSFNKDVLLANVITLLNFRNCTNKLLQLH